MNECNGDHPRGYVFTQQETLRVSFVLGKRNKDRVNHVTSVLVSFLARMAIRAGRVPLLESVEVYFTDEVGGESRVHANCTVETYDPQWGCMVRALLTSRMEQLMAEQAGHMTGGMLN